MKIRTKILRYLKKKYVDGSPTELYNYIGSSGDHNTRVMVTEEFKKILGDINAKNH